MNKRSTQPTLTDIRLLAYIQKYTRKNPVPPSIREMVKDLKISSTSVVNYRLTFLAELGLLQKIPKISRGLRVTPAGKAFLKSRAS